MEEHGLSQNALHKKTRVSQGSISRYLNDIIITPADWRTVEKIGRHFPARDQARLILAHARDVIHPSLADKITGGARRQRPAKHKSPNPRDRMPAKLREAYDGLGAAAIEKSAVADLIIAYAKIVGGK
jgi:hypothetical protein